MQFSAQQALDAMSFSALQRAENSSIELMTREGVTIPNVSVLFSEPKIPQSASRLRSALIRSPFQCSSASRKFLNHTPPQHQPRRRHVSVLFSEPKIPQSFARRPLLAPKRVFQCSSASRKFLNSSGFVAAVVVNAVSVLFSEPKIPQSNCAIVVISFPKVSVLFSEPKIPQFRRRAALLMWSVVSVLFSEPKIPQWEARRRRLQRCSSFSALQRAENSSILTQSAMRETNSAFQCSSASRKFLNPRQRTVGAKIDYVSVLFSEPKIPQSEHRRRSVHPSHRFQCSSASRKFLNPAYRSPHERPHRRFSALQRAENSSMIGQTPHPFAVYAVSVLFSEPKIPQSRARLDLPQFVEDGFSALQRAENSSM